MFDIHIEEFFLDCVKILNQLYAAFPKKSNVYVEDISGADQPDEYGLHSDRFQSCFGAMLWLEKEDFIRFESTMKQEAIDQATLTSKGLRLLSSTCRDEEVLSIIDKIMPPAPQLAGLPNIEALKYLMKHGTSIQLSKAMQHLLHQYAAN